MLTYLVERLNKLSFLKYLLDKFFPIHCLGCRLESNNDESVCSVCLEELRLLVDRCWVCSTRLYEEEEHIFCQRCFYQKGMISKSFSVFENNSLVNNLIEKGVIKKKIRESIFLAQCMRKYTDIQNVKNIFVLNKMHKGFVEKYLDIPTRVLTYKNHNADEQVNLFIPKLESIACVEKKLQGIFKKEHIDVKLYSVSIQHLAKNSFSRQKAAHIITGFKCY